MEPVDTEMDAQGDISADGVTLAPRDRPESWTSDEWSTPRDIVEAWGVFDLDPCARPETAKAPRWYTKVDNGLLLPWHGRVWLNPPYSRPRPWLEKAIQEVREGRATHVVALLPAATDTGWFHDCVLGRATLQFRRGRIKFIGWRGTPIGSPKSGSVFAIYEQATLLDTAP